MSDRGISKLQKIFSGGLWAWVLICLVTPYFPNRGLIHNIFTYAPPGLLCLPLALTCIVIFIRTVRKRSNQLDFANLLVCFGSSLIILGFQFHINGPRSGAIRVLTINVEMTNRNVPGLKEEIIAKHIDLVMMQEVKGGADSPAAKIMHDFPSWHVATVGEVAILSRWRLSHIERFPMRSLPRKVRFISDGRIAKAFLCDDNALVGSAN